MNKNNITAELVRVTADEKIGLSSVQVADRERAGLTNEVKNYNSKSYGRIFFDNICTFYNLLCLACFIALLAVHTEHTPLSNYVFIVIYLVNIIIGVTQEIRAKKTLEKLSLVATPDVTVIRDGKEQNIPVSKIVADDILVLTLGMQIPADCEVVSGCARVDESIITGESVAVKKTVGDKLLGGSNIVGGSLIVRAVNVGESSYVRTLMRKAKKFKKTNSELLRTMKHIINVVGILIIPIAVLSAIINYNYLSGTFTGEGLVAETVIRTTAVIVGMIPGGMFLLTTVSLALGIIKLSGQNTLVQDMYSLEMLARVNVLCLDKTGTITDGRLAVAEVVELEKCPYNTVIANFELITNDHNATAEALRSYFKSDEKLTAKAILPFDSDKKYSAVTFEDGQTYVLGAPDRINALQSDEIKYIVRKHTSAGRRVIALCATDNQIADDKIDLSNARPLTLIALEDNIRPEAFETIKWFNDNDVSVKVISGDDPTTVSIISKKAGVKNAENFISLTDMTDEQVIDVAEKYTVFGRVSPEQKALIIKTLKKDGSRVAMTGDGVNDILAMKEADCSVTFAAGNSATRSLAHVVLMTNDFNCMPAVVREGRRAINNVERSSALYIMKTVFIILLAAAAILLGKTYPLTTGDILPLEMMIIGFPSIALAVQPNTARVKGKFIDTVLSNALPGSFLILLNVALSLNANHMGICPTEITKTVLVLSITFGGLAFLTVLCMPFDKFRLILVCFIAVVLLAWAFFVMGSPLFALPKIDVKEHYSAIIFLVVLFIVDIPITYGLKRFLSFAFSKR